MMYKKKTIAMLLCIIMIFHMSIRQVPALAAEESAVNSPSLTYGIDTFSFENNPTDFFSDLSTSTTYTESGYKISDEYLSILYQGLNNNEKNGIRSMLSQEWSGSSFGMSAVLALVKAEKITPSFFQPEANTLYNLNSPADSSSTFNLINYYQLIGLTNTVRQAKEGLMNQPEDVRGRAVVDAVNTSKYPVIIGFDILDQETGTRIGSHTVVGYDIIYTDDGNYTISIWDPNHMEQDLTLEFSENYTAVFSDFYSTESLYPSIKYALTVEGSPQTYDYKNLQRLLELQYTSYTLPVDSNDANTQLTINYTDFSIFLYNDDGEVLSSAYIYNGDKIEGDLNIIALGAENEIGSELSLAYALPLPGADEYYQIQPAESEQNAVASYFTGGTGPEYTTSISCSDVEDGFYTCVQADLGGTITLYGNGSIATSYAEMVNQTITASLNQVTTDWYTVMVEGTDTGLAVEPRASQVMIYSNSNVLLDLTVSNDYNSLTFESADVNATGVTLIQTSPQMTALISSDGILLANESIGYAVIYFTLGGSEVPGVYNVAPGSKLTQPSDPTKAGYTFDGWYKDLDYTQEWSFSTDTVNSDMILYAKWLSDTAIPPALDVTSRTAYIAGYENNTIRPAANITRQEFAQLLYNLMTEESRTHYYTVFNSFTDVNAGWSNAAISTLAYAGIISGYTDGSFKPQNNITRAELVVMVCKFYDITGGSASKFTDTIGHWAKSSIDYAGEQKWINGYGDGTFLPNKHITRAETVCVLNAVTGRDDSDIALIKDMKTFTDNMQTSAWYYAQIQVAANSY